jgi:TPP-dependent pyruvate/acetoin dehydrogenase alpha subunit
MAKILNSKSDRGAPSPHAEKESFSLISNEKLLAIYAAMVKCRMLEQRATLLFQQGKLGSDLHASEGREASAAAIAVDLQPQDTLCMAPGDWLPAFVKGVSLEGIFRVLAPAGSQADSGATSEPSQKNILVPLNNTPPIEMVRERAADALVQKKGAIVAVFIAPGPDSLKPWHKTMATAAAKRLPIVFVHYADQPAEPASTRLKSGAGNPQAVLHGVPAIIVDALDPVAAYRVAYEAIIRARQARGATLLECTVHPVLPPASGMENGEQLNGMKSADPLTAMESYLKRKAIEPGPHNRLIVESFISDLDLATRFLSR